MEDRRRSTSYRIGRLQRLPAGQSVPTLNFSSSELQTICNLYPQSIGRNSSESESRVLVLYCTNNKSADIGDAEAVKKVVGSSTYLHDKTYSFKFYSKAEIPPFILPVRDYDRIRLLYWIYGYSAPFTFSNHLIDNWVRLAEDVEAAYKTFDGFVICVDKRYICKCASALSFLFHHLGKPVIVTSFEDPQRTIDRNNLINSVRAAGSLDIPEVCIQLNGKLSRGNRCTVSSDMKLTSTMAPLAVISETSLTVNWKLVFRSHYPNVFNTRIYLSTNVVRLKLNPSTSIEEVKRWVTDESILGLIIQIQTDQKAEDLEGILTLLRTGIDRGLVIATCADYKTKAESSLQKALYDLGVIDGADVTSETALIKMAYIIARPDWIGDVKKEALTSTLRGEITISSDHHDCRDLELIKQFTKFMKVTKEEEIEKIRQTLYPPLLMAAANDGNMELLDVLSQTPANLCAVDYDLRTALHVAASQGNADVVKFLLDIGVSVNRRDIFNDTPLMGAVKNKQLPIIKMLMKAGAQLSLPSVVLGTAICEAVSKNDIVLLRGWKMAGADFNCADYDGRTALHVAASLCQVEIAMFLLDNGAQPDVTDHFGNTPLTDAKRSAHKPIISILERFNAISTVKYVTLVPGSSNVSP